MKGKEMRLVVDCNPNKRGCGLCADVCKEKVWSREEGKMVTRKYCPYDECPYHELDEFKSYAEYDEHAKKEGQRQMESWLKKVFELSEK